MYLAQNQTITLTCIMFQVKHHFIYVLLFTEPGSLSIMSVAVGQQPGGQS